MKKDKIQDEETFAKKTYIEYSTKCSSSLFVETKTKVDAEITEITELIYGHFKDSFNEAFTRINDYILKTKQKKDKLNLFLLNIKRNKKSFFEKLYDELSKNCFYDDLTFCSLKKLKEVSDRITDLAQEKTVHNHFVFKVDLTENGNYKMFNLILNTFLTLSIKIEYKKKIYLLVVLDQLTTLFQNLDINLLSKVDFNNFLVVDTKSIFSRVLFEYFYLQHKQDQEWKLDFYADDAVFSYLDGCIKSVTIDSFNRCFKLFLIDHFFFGKRSELLFVEAESKMQKKVAKSHYHNFIFSLIAKVLEYYASDDNNYSSYILFLEFFQSFSSKSKTVKISYVLDKFIRQKSILIQQQGKADSIYMFEKEFHQFKWALDKLIAENEGIAGQIAQSRLLGINKYLQRVCEEHPYSSESVKVPITKTGYQDKMNVCNELIANELSKFLVVEKTEVTKEILNPCKMKMRIMAFYKILCFLKDKNEEMFKCYYAFIDVYLIMSAEFTIDGLYGEYLDKLNKSDTKVQRADYYFQKCLIEFLYVKLMSKEGEVRLIKNYYAKVVLFKDN